MRRKTIIILDRIKFLVTDTIIIKLCSFNSSLGDANKGKFFTREKKK